MHIKVPKIYENAYIFIYFLGTDWVTRDILPSIRKFGTYKLIEEHKKEVRHLFNKINFLESESKKIKRDLCKTKYPKGGVVYAVDYSNEFQEIYRIGMTADMKTRKQLYDTHTLHNHHVSFIFEFDCPKQLESNILVLLHKYRYFPNKKDFFECKLSTIKSAIKTCAKNIKTTNAKKYKQKGGSKTNKNDKNPNMIDKKLTTLRKEKDRLQIRITRLKKEINIK